MEILLYYSQMRKSVNVFASFELNKQDHDGGCNNEVEKDKGRTQTKQADMTGA